MNNMTGNTSACNYSFSWERSHFYIHFALCITNVIVAPVAVAGNVLVLAAIWRNPSRLRTPTYVLLGGLALTDLCTGLVTRPFFFTARMVELNAGQDTSSPFFCDAYFTFVTMLTITLMSIERWLHMSHRSLTARRACAIYGVFLVISAPFVVFILEPLLAGGVCSLHVYVGIDIASSCLVMVCLMTTSVAYFKVFQIIRHHQNRVQANPRSQNFEQPAINMEKCKRSLSTIKYIVGLFYLSFLPYGVSIGVLVHYYNENALLAYRVTRTFLVISSSLNPVLYCWRIKGIRVGIKHILKKFVCRGN